MADPYGPPPLFSIPPLGEQYRHPSHGRSPPHRGYPASDHQAGKERSSDGDVMALILGLPGSALSQPVREALERVIANTGHLQEEIARRAAHEEYLDLLAHRCETTKLLNRRGMAREITRIATRMAHDGGDGGTLVLLHLDGFEDVRRGHGLAASDAARQHAAEALSTGLRLSDLVAAVGGGDFAVFLALTHGEEAETKAGALADRLNSPPFMCEGEPHPFTIAMGTAEMKPDSGLRSLMAEADANLRLPLGPAG